MFRDTGGEVGGGGASEGLLALAQQTTHPRIPLRTSTPGAAASHLLLSHLPPVVVHVMHCEWETRPCQQPCRFHRR